MELIDATAVLAALSQPTRLRAFRLIVSGGKAGLGAGEVARQLGVPQNTMSSHLAILARAGLIAPERRGRAIIYRAEVACVRRLAGFLVSECCGGRPELCDPLIDELIARRSGGTDVAKAPDIDRI